MGAGLRWTAAMALGALGTDPGWAETDEYLASREAAVQWSRDAHAEQQTRRAELGALAEAWLVSPEEASERAHPPEPVPVPDRLAVEATRPAEAPSPSHEEVPEAPRQDVGSSGVLSSAVSWALSLREARARAPSPVESDSAPARPDSAPARPELADAISRLGNGIRGWLLGETPERRSAALAAPTEPTPNREAPARLASLVESPPRGAPPEVESAASPTGDAATADPSPEARRSSEPRPGVARAKPPRAIAVAAERPSERIRASKPDRPAPTPAAEAERPATQATERARSRTHGSVARAKPPSAPTSRPPVARPTESAASVPVAPTRIPTGQPVARPKVASARPSVQAPPAQPGKARRPKASGARQAGAATAKPDRPRTTPPPRKRPPQVAASAPARPRPPPVSAPRRAPDRRVANHSVQPAPASSQRPSDPGVGSIPRGNSDEAWRLRSRELARAEIASAREMQARLTAAPARRVATTPPRSKEASPGRARQAAPRGLTRAPAVPEHRHDEVCDHPLGWALVEECDEWGCGIYEEHCDEHGCTLYELEFFFAGH